MTPLDHARQLWAAYSAAAKARHDAEAAWREAYRTNRAVWGPELDAMRAAGHALGEARTAAQEACRAAGVEWARSRYEIGGRSGTETIRG